MLFRSELSEDQNADIFDPRQYFYMAKWLAVLGKNEKSLDWLERAMQEKCVDLPSIYNSWDFRNLRNEPRFRAILRQMNFPEYKSAAPLVD